MTEHHDPPLTCDLIMKGGITSGVLYPRLVTSLAKDYRLVNVGGSSAGTIAAAAAAAAEYGRGSGGFEKLAELPDVLGVRTGGRSTLAQLFQPAPGTRRYFRLLEVGSAASGSRPARVLGAVLRGFWAPALLGLLPLALAGAATAAAAGSAGSGWLVALTWVLALVLAVVTAAGAVAVALARGAARDVPAHGFGLCDGAQHDPDAGSALTPWLHERLQDLAGVGTVLTFGDLRSRGVTLRAMTTNLTTRQPVAMPFSAGGWFYDPAEFRALFPEDVVDWMERHPRRPSSKDAALLHQLAAPLLPLPSPDDLPVVVATRMSLSFPLLISAVPLYAADFRRPETVAAKEAARAWRRQNPDAPLTDLPPTAGVLERVWFTDGGLCSNLPLHFFDAPLPSRPTFAVDLASFADDFRLPSTDQRHNVFLPRSYDQGALRRWYRPPDAAGFGRLAWFGRALVETARGWVDANHLVAPGFRDRTVTIYVGKGEGGMNLDMAKDVVDVLVTRGAAAGDVLRETFAGEAPGAQPSQAWLDHQWIRLRTTSAGVEHAVVAYGDGLCSAEGGPPTYLQKLDGSTAATFPLEPERRLLAVERAQALRALSSRWAGVPSAFATGALARVSIRIGQIDGTGSGW